MTSSMYCFISGGKVRFEPVDSFNSPSRSDDNHLKLQINRQKRKRTPFGNIKATNLVYELNNPSLSDLESDAHASNGNESEEEQAEETGLEENPTATVDAADKERVRSILQEYSTHASYLPEYFVDLESNLNDDYGQIRELLIRVFKEWTDMGSIEVKPLTGGITNMLLSCTNRTNGDQVLMRVYGNGTNLIIDRHREFISHLVLHSLNLAPPIFARFKNGLVYGFLPGRSLAPAELRHEKVYPLIAQQLGNWHSQVDRSMIQDGVEKLRKFTSSLKKKNRSNSEARTPQLATSPKNPHKHDIFDIWDLIEDWIKIVPFTNELMDSFQENLDFYIDESNLRQSVLDEFRWLKTATSSSKSPVVISHCDLLSGNIIIGEDFDFTEGSKDENNLESNPVRFIDYEYMLPAPRAFDIANHLAEWQGFDCDRSAIPDPSPANETMFNWVKAYLNNVNATEDEIINTISEISFYYGMPGFYWGIWAMIQSRISNIDFDYSEYGKSRLQEYWDWKKKFIK
ncbi:Piso0_002316 [Millerozyma farinosa CBS 7064]|uniref:ethanolamine kinase n=1 Tax=Pichia sorbitophila (strain ATCC MYA-4447 / BCRC 22081 / CBS 7064 / NBRC 10061 / NRRL Y-12695) TaxID=559304 RepID=G8YCA3_PICSO|nr:Piso0_002316 [Millerozyma farinosa CBS 7064]